MGQEKIIIIGGAVAGAGYGYGDGYGDMLQGTASVMDAYGNLGIQQGQASIVQQKDVAGGEIVVAFVVERTDASRPEPDALDALCLDHLARFKRPKRYVTIEALPKNSYGKILKTELRARLEASGTDVSER